MPQFCARTLITASVLSATLALPAASVQIAHAAPAPSAPSAGAGDKTRTTVPTLEARATLSADYEAGGPPSGSQATPANGRQGPFPSQVIPGFSAVVDNGDGTYWAMPDNGFGSKANSADFLLRIYLIRPRWESARGGVGRIKVLRHISLNDRRRVLDFPITRERGKRLLTGADFDIESLVRGKDGSWWIGEEFGPFLLHFAADGTLLDKPVRTPGARSPQSPYLGSRTPTVKASRGFEAMAVSANGRFLYPILEGALINDRDQRRRWVLEYDTVARRWTGRRLAYQTHQAANVIGDAFMTGRGKMIIIERDDVNGPQAVIKRLYEINLNRSDHGYVRTRLVADLLKIDNPDHIGMNGDDPGAVSRRPSRSPCSPSRRSFNWAMGAS